MNSNLIVYYSFSGNNRIVAEYLQDKLEADIEEVKELRKRTGLTLLLDTFIEQKTVIRKPRFMPDTYDHVVFVAPVWVGTIATPMRRFMEEYGQDLKSYSVIILGAHGGNKWLPVEAERVMKKKPQAFLELKTEDLLSKDEDHPFWEAAALHISETDIKKFKKELDKFIVQLAAGEWCIPIQHSSQKVSFLKQNLEFL